MSEPKIDWDVVMYDYDPEAREIRVHNWHTGGADEEPLPLALVVRGKNRVHNPLLTAYIEILTRRLVELANLKLAADHEKRTTDEFIRTEPKGPKQ